MLSGTQGKPYLCPEHLLPAAAAGATAKAAHVVPLHDDPIVRGNVHRERRNEAGEQFAGKRDTVDAAAASKKRRTSKAAARSHVSPHEQKIADLMRELKAKDAEIKQLKKEAASRADATSGASAASHDADDGQGDFVHSYKWTTDRTAGDDGRCVENTSLSIEAFEYFVAVAETCGADVVYKRLAHGQKTTWGFRDALTVGIARLFVGPRKWRQFARYTTGTGAKGGMAANLAESAIIATNAVMRRSLLRHPDREVVEFGRPATMTGEFSDTYRVMVVIDGFAFPVEYVSPPELHRLIHSVYKGTAVAQATILVDARFQIMAITPAYGGAAGEGPYVEASGIFEKPEDNGCWLLEAGDWIMSDKGYRIQQYLETLGLNLLKPTEMARGNMTEAQASASRRISQARAHSERVVFRVRRFDIFNGRKVQQAEWPMVDEYLDFVCAMVMCLGPLSTRDPIGAEGEGDKEKLSDGEEAIDVADSEDEVEDDALLDALYEMEIEDRETAAAEEEAAKAATRVTRSGAKSAAGPAAAAT